MIFLKITETIQAAVGSNPIEAADLEHSAEQSLHLKAADTSVDVGLLLTDDDQIHELNRSYRGIDAPTDVLAFPGGETDPDTGTVYLGDVIISYPRAQAQARAGGHSIHAELQLLVVHGVLHLLGYDHTDEQSKMAMWSAQEEILTHLGNEITVPKFDNA